MGQKRIRTEKFSSSGAHYCRISRHIRPIYKKGIVLLVLLFTTPVQTLSLHFVNSAEKKLANENPIKEYDTRSVFVSYFVNS